MGKALEAIVRELNPMKDFHRVTTFTGLLAYPPLMPKDGGEMRSVHLFNANIAKHIVRG